MMYRDMALKDLLKWFIKKLLYRDKVEYLVFLCIFVYTIIFSYYTILRHYAFESSAWDLGGYEQALWSTINYGRLFWGTTDSLWNPSGSFFGVNFSPILFLVLPIYAIYQAPETLLILQSFFLALGALPIYWITRDEFNKTAALTFVVAYLLYPPLHGVNFFDFHVEAFLPAFFLFAFYYFWKGEWPKYFVFLILALMCIHWVVPFIVIFMGFYGLWVNRTDLVETVKSGVRGVFASKMIFYSFVTIVIGVSWFIIGTKVVDFINPPPRPPLYTFEKFAHIRSIHGPLDLIIAVFSNPLYAIEVMLSSPYSKFMYLAVLLFPVACLSLFDLPKFLITTPWLVASLLSSLYAYYTPVGFQYPGFTTAFIFISAVYGAKRLVWIRQSFNSKSLRKILGVVLICSVFSFVTLSPLRVFGPKPQVTFHDEILISVIKMIPQDASIATQPNIFPHVSQRLKAYPYPVADVDYILLDTTSGWYRVHVPPPSSAPTFNDALPEMVKNGSYGLVVAIDGIYLFEKDHKGGLITVYKEEHGLSVKFYNNENLDGKAVVETIVLSVNLGWEKASPLPGLINEDNFSAVFEGYLYIVEKGNYVFRLLCDGGSKFYIDEKLIMGASGSLVFDNTTTVFLAKGYHKIRIEYMEHGERASVHFYWKPPWSKSMKIVPTEYLYLPNHYDLSENSLTSLATAVSSYNPFHTFDLNAY